MIRLTPNDIAKHWDIIKYVLIKGDFITPDHRQRILNEMLHDLLCEKAQCFFRFGIEDRKIQTIIITRLEYSGRALEKFLYFKCLYSFKSASREEWQDIWDFIRAFAKKTECKYILMDSFNERMFKILARLEIPEIYRTFRWDFNMEI